MDYHSKTYLEFKDQVNNDFDIAWCGSSINKWSARSDADKRAISEMCEAHLDSKCKVMAFSRPAAVQSYYSSIIDFVEDNKSEKDVSYVIEVSLETFAPTWRTWVWDQALMKEEILLEENIYSAFVNPLKVFKYKFGIKSQESRDEVGIFHGKEYLGKANEIFADSKSIIRNRYIAQYLGLLDENNKEVVSLLKLIKKAKKQNLTLYFYISPINYMAGIKKVPNTFEEILDNKRTYFDSLFSTNGCKYIDLSKELSSEYFTHAPAFPNGHLNERGRNIVARRVSEMISCNQF